MKGARPSHQDDSRGLECLALKEMHIGTLFIVGEGSALARSLCFSIRVRLSETG